MKHLSILLLLLVLSPARGDIKLPAILSDHMVLKKDANVPIWGTAAPGEAVSVTLNGQTTQTSADADGKWRVVLDLSQSPQGPFEMVVKGNNQITISDVVVGEVWVASGQSNMEWPLKDTNHATAEIAASANPLLREFRVTKTQAPEPQEDCQGRWQIADPAPAGEFSGVGYYFGKELQKELQVPVGIINSSFGATHSEMWTSEEGINAHPELKATQDRYRTLLADYPARKTAWVTDFAKWLDETGRGDKSTENLASFTTGPTVDWTKVSNPKKLFVVKMTEYGLPEHGAIWFRTEIDLTADQAKAPLKLYFPYLDGFESFYWNGELVKTFTSKDHPGTFESRRGEDYGPLHHVVPAENLREGKNTLAIRLYAPGTPARFPLSLKINGADFGGPWLAKAEYALPAPSDEAKPPAVPVSPPAGARQTSMLFNAMIHPLLPYAISGVIWYQGEANTPRGYQYRTTFPLMITDWRNHWQRGDFPFLFCQLASTPERTEPDKSRWAELRAAQSAALSLPNTGQAVLVDFQDGGNLHPTNKDQVAHRLAVIALAKTYGKKIAWSGPAFQDMTIEGNKARLRFTHTEGGLVAQPVPATCVIDHKTGTTAPVIRHRPESELEGFALCGADKRWVWADARIDGNTVVVSSDEVPQPIAVRYGWSDNPTMNLTNAAGLPAAPFKTDDFPWISQSVKY